jgi:methylated-DNA-protein-cysteine methyltransferase-like protein
MRRIKPAATERSPTDCRDACARILAAVAAIPRGTVAAYGEIAAAARLPGRARMVAWALKQAPPSARIPWHRVLRSDGRIAFPEGSDAFRQQVAKLAREGVTVVKGRVARRNDGAKSLDALLWGPRRE